MRTRVALALAAGVLALAAAAAYALRPRPEPALPEFMAARALALSAQLAQVGGRYHLLLGDSQAERLYVGGLCPQPVVNAGISGARAGELRRVAERLVLPRRAETVTLVVGTNDLLRRRNPSDPAAEAAFRAEIRALLEAVRPRAARVLLAGLAPLDTGRALAFDVVAAPRFAAILAEECARAECRLVDLFGGASAPSPDGVHLAVAAMTAPGGVAARLRAAICPAP